MVLIPRKYEISIWGAILVPLGDSLAMSVKNFGFSYEAKIIKRIFLFWFSSYYLDIANHVTNSCGDLFRR